MSLHPQDIPDVPPLTATTARAAFPHGNRYMTMRDELGAFYADQDFARLFPTCGQPAATPWRLALVLVFQFAEGLSDAQAADAVRSRIDWKYALRLELSDPGFDASVLSEFRTRVVEGQAEQQLLDTMLQRFKTAGLLTARGRQRTDSTHVLAAVRRVNRLVLVGETVRHALNTLAGAAPEWLKLQLEPACVERYGIRLDDYRLPQGQEARQALAAQIGADGLAPCCVRSGPLMHRTGYASYRRSNPAANLAATIRSGRQHRADALAGTARPTARGTTHQFALRSRSTLWQQAHHPVAGLQSAFDGNLR